MKCEHAGCVVFDLHVYGPIHTPALARVGVLGVMTGGYHWPGEFDALEAFLADEP